MHVSTPTRRRWAWVTAMVILMAAFAPAVSAWLAHASGSKMLWQEICTTQEARKVVLVQYGASGEPADSKGHLTQGHCPMCVLQSQASALPPPDVQPRIPAASGSYERPVLFLQAPRTLFVWASALARAPPISA